MNEMAADESNLALNKSGLKKSVIKPFNRLPEKITRIEDHRAPPNFKAFLHRGSDRIICRLRKRCA
jgi:hypothetical protein